MPALYTGPRTYPSSSTFPYGTGVIVRPSPVVLPVWTVFARDPGFSPTVALPILDLQAVIRHLGVGSAVLTTPYSPERWAALGPASGLILYRNGVVQFSGLVNARQLDWDRTAGTQVIKVEVVGDEQVLADRLVMPDPADPPASQTVNDYWSFTGPASSAMWTLISDQAGPTCRPDRAVPGLTMGPDPGVGVSRTWTAAFGNVMDTLSQISVAADGAALGVSIVGAGGSLVANVVQSTDRTAEVKFSADLSNLVGFSYREEAPTATHALVGGSGSLKARARGFLATTEPLDLAWGRQVWSFTDRSDTSDPTELANAASDALAGGGAKVNLSVTLTDSQAATYNLDWNLGDKVTVYVGLPGQSKAAVVQDVVREVSFTVSDTGAEVITPAIGSYDASAVIPTPTQRTLARVGSALGDLITRK